MINYIKSNLRIKGIQIINHIKSIILQYKNLIILIKLLTKSLNRFVTLPKFIIKNFIKKTLCYLYALFSNINLINFTCVFQVYLLFILTLFMVLNKEIQFIMIIKIIYKMKIKKIRYRNFQKNQKIFLESIKKEVMNN